MTGTRRSPVRAAAAVFIRGDRVLLGLRARHRASYPGVWDLPGGHVEAGELPRQTMVRELREELGTHCTVHDVQRWKAVRIAGYELNLYFVRRWSGEPTNRDPDEHDEVRWLTLGELEGLPLSHPKLLPLLQDALSCERSLPPPPRANPIAFHELSPRTQHLVLAVADGIFARAYGAQSGRATEGVRATLRSVRSRLGLSTQRALIDWFHHLATSDFDDDI